MEYPDVMIDLETTGTDPSATAIIQLSAVRFNYAERAIGPMFDRCLKIPGNRRWDEDTRDWWMQTNDTLLGQILANGEDPLLVMTDFQTWCCSTQGLLGSRMWAKPISFEWPFVQSYSRQFDVMLPFHFRDAIDLNSFNRGLADNAGAHPLDKKVEFTGVQHNAIDDVLHQIKTALMARELVASS